MISLSYSFCMSMLHSLWQAGLMWLLYIIAERIFLKNNSPLEKRNLLFVIITTQFFLFIITFFIYNSISQTALLQNNIGNWVNAVLPEEKFHLLAPWLFSVYSFIIVFKLIKAIYIRVHFEKQYQLSLQQPAANLKIFTELKMKQLGIRRKVKLFLSPLINSPATFGFLKPVILLPVALMNNIDTAQAETLILHELAHIRINDYLLNWILFFNETIFFFNPFIKIIGKKIRLEREKFCDLNVMEFNYSPVIYAEALLQAIHLKTRTPNFQLAAVGKKEELLRRIHFFINNQNRKSSQKINLIIPIISLIIFLFFSSILILKTTGNAKTQLVTSIVFNDFLPSNINSKENKFVIKIPPVNRKVQSAKLENHFKQIQITANTIRNKVEKINEEVNQNLLMPVTVKESDGSTEIIIKEESSGTKSSVIKIYRLNFENGKWTLKPQWMGISKEMNKDSISEISTIDNLSEQ